MLSVLRIKRAWSPGVGLAPKPLVWYSTGSSVMAMPASRGAQQSQRQRGVVGIGPPIPVVVHVMELAHAGVARLQHLT